MVRSDEIQIGALIRWGLISDLRASRSRVSRVEVNNQRLLVGRTLESLAVLIHKSKVRGSLSYGKVESSILSGNSGGWGESRGRGACDGGDDGRGLHVDILSRLGKNLWLWSAIEIIDGDGMDPRLMSVSGFFIFLQNVSQSMRHTMSHRVNKTFGRDYYCDQHSVDACDGTPFHIFGGWWLRTLSAHQTSKQASLAPRRTKTKTMPWWTGLPKATTPSFLPSNL